MQPLTDWAGDVSSLIDEMKRQAGVTTDQALVRFMGAAHGTITNWRARGAVPRAALLRFEEKLAKVPANPGLRAVLARAVALRIPELWFQQISERGAEATREVPYITVAMSFNVIVEEVQRSMEAFEKERGVSSQVAMRHLLEDEHFLHGLLDWLKNASAVELLLREASANPTD